LNENFYFTSYFKMFGSFLPMVIFFYSRFLRLDLEPFVTARFSRSDLGSCVLGFHFALERFPLGFWTTSVHAPGPDPRLPLGPARQKRACIRLVFPPTDLLFASCFSSPQVPAEKPARRSGQQVWSFGVGGSVQFVLAAVGSCSSFGFSRCRLLARSVFRVWIPPLPPVLALRARALLGFVSQLA
jgi:hypothetical protein